MKKSPWKPSIQLDSSEIQYLLTNPNYHYRTHKSPQLASILRQINTIQNLLNQISLRQIYIYFLKLSSHPSIRFRVFLMQVFLKRTVYIYAWILRQSGYTTTDSQHEGIKGQPRLSYFSVVYLGTLSKHQDRILSFISSSTSNIIPTFTYNIKHFGRQIVIT